MKTVTVAPVYNPLRNFSNYEGERTVASPAANRVAAIPFSSSSPSRVEAPASISSSLDRIRDGAA
jgi:hypothetical protein